MAISYVNSAYAFDNTGIDALLVFPAISLTAGNCVVVVLSNYTLEGPRTVSSISDTAGNTYVKCGNTGGGNATHKMECWAAYNVTGHANNIITVTFDGPFLYGYGIALQYSGVATSSAFDAQSTFKLDSTEVLNHTSNNVTTTTANQLLVGWFVTWDVVASYSSYIPSTIRQGGGAAAVDRILSAAAGDYNTGVTTDSVNAQVSCTWSFKESGL